MTPSRAGCFRSRSKFWQADTRSLGLKTRSSSTSGPASWRAIRARAQRRDHDDDQRSLPHCPPRRRPLEAAMTATDKFDPNDEIKEHVAQIETAEGSLIEHKRAAAALLQDVA